MYRVKVVHKVQEMSNGTSPETQSTISTAKKAKEEISRYVSDTTMQDDPLVFWKANSKRYPILSILVRKYLVILRAFSSAGHIVNKKRFCLLLKMQDKNIMILIINCDTDITQPYSEGV